MKLERFDVATEVDFGPTLFRFYESISELIQDSESMYNGLVNIRFPDITKTLEEPVW